MIKLQTPSNNIQPRSSRVLCTLRKGGIVSVLKLNLSDPRSAEIAGCCGTDAIWLCNEHVPNDWSTIENQIRAAKLNNIDSIVRVSRGSYSDYIKPFEADATGIMVPHVKTEEEARQIVEWARFYPIGKRALDGGNADAKFCLMPMDQYIRNGNKERFIILQIESPEALENVDAIAAVPGYDILLFGAGDFSHRIGKAEQMDAPEVVAARKRIGKAATQYGKFAMSAGLPVPLRQMVKEGYRMFNVGADVVALTEYFQREVCSLAEQTKKLKRSSS